MTEKKKKKKRAARGTVLAKVLTLFVLHKEVDTIDIQGLGISRKASSVMLNRLLKRGMIKRQAKGVYSLS